MKIPSIISAYVKAKNDRDTDAVVACFADDAVVHDEGKEHHGLAAIREWCGNSFNIYQYTIDPTGIAQRGQETILTATLAGNFPGSPVSLDFCFTSKTAKSPA